MLNLDNFDTDFEDFEDVVKGTYVIKCIEAKTITSTNGYNQIQLTWEVVGHKFKVNYDNYTYGHNGAQDLSVKAVKFGIAKIKALSKAVGYNIQSFDPTVFCKYMLQDGGREVQVTLDKKKDKDGNETNYPEIRDIASFAPVVKTEISEEELSNMFTSTKQETTSDDEEDPFSD